MEPHEQILTFVVEWFDRRPQLLKRFTLRYYPSTSEVDMKDLDTKRMFLKKTKLPEDVSSSDFIVGGHVLLLSRDLKIVDYGDAATRRLLESIEERTVIVVPPELYQSVGGIVKEIEGAGFTLFGIRTISARGDDAGKVRAFLGMPDTSVSFRPECAEEREGRMVALGFHGTNSVEAVKLVCNDLSGGEVTSGIACASTAEDAALFEEFFLASKAKARFLQTAVLEEGSTCCAILPHAVKSRNVGSILDVVLETGKFMIPAMQLFYLDRKSAKELLQVYDGVVNEYHSMVDEMCSGPVVAMEIRLQKQENGDLRNDAEENVVEAFREVAGPWDVDMAKELFPHSLRGRFGKGRVKNAVHCTDLAEDGLVEATYFFDTVAS